MLKDLLNKKAEKIANSLADGYVDVKAYKHFEDGSKKLIYHNTGDNTITNWMRQVIVLLLSGYSLGYHGHYGDTNQGTLVSKPKFEDHSASTNKDGYCLNGEQYMWSPDNRIQYPITGSELYSSSNTFALFPTKILLGTGKEYSSWEELKEENQDSNSDWYANMVETYGSGDEALAKANFDALVTHPANRYSATVGTQGNYNGTTNAVIKTVTVNDPDTSSNISSSAELAERFGVVGAIKTLYCPGGTASLDDNYANFLETTVSDSGRLVKGQYRGGGRPCFIYFNRANTSADNKLDWSDVTSDISVQKDSSTEYLNRLTFRVIIPSQSSGSGAIGVYNPFNGYTFKQVGLFNDALFETVSDASANSSSNAIRGNMQSGMLLAIKNIQKFSKSADESIEFTWTLTI